MIKRLTSREQKILIACLSTVVFCIFVNFVVLPINEKARAIRKEIEAYQKQSEIDFRILQKAENYDGRYGIYLRQFRQPGTSEKTFAVMLSEIERVGGKYEIRITSLEPKGNKSTKQSNQFSISLAATSKLTDIIHFLYTLQQPPYLFDVNEVEFEKLAREKEGVITMQCILSKPFIQNEGRISQKKREEGGNEERFFNGIDAV